jgi:hypothetical protein
VVALRAEKTWNRLDAIGMQMITLTGGTGWYLMSLMMARGRRNGGSAVEVEVGSESVMATATGDEGAHGRRLRERLSAGGAGAVKDAESGMTRTGSHICVGFAFYLQSDCTLYFSLVVSQLRGHVNRMQCA